jgi:hypothetical protein
MARLTQLLDLAEVRDLDDQQRKLLREVITNEVRSNPQIHQILTARLRERLREFQGQTRPPQARDPGSNESA